MELSAGSAFFAAMIVLFGGDCMLDCRHHSEVAQQASSKTEGETIKF